jgi:hypothetical protein
LTLGDSARTGATPSTSQPQTNPKYQYVNALYSSLALFETTNRVLQLVDNTIVASLSSIDPLLCLWLTNIQLFHINQRSIRNLQTPLCGLLLRATFNDALDARRQLHLRALRMAEDVTKRIFYRVIHEVISGSVIVEIRPGAANRIRPSCFCSGLQFFI